MGVKTTVDVYIEIEDLEYHALVTGTLYAGRPGRYYGPPEKCYEDEPPEYEIDSIQWLPEPPQADLTEEQSDYLYNAAFDAALDAAAAYEEGEDRRDYYED